MKIWSPRPQVLASVIVIAFLGGACGGKEAPADGTGGPGAAGGTGAPAAAAGSGAPAAGGAAATGPNVLGERLTTRVINDPTQKMPLGVMAVPASWTYDATVTWKYGDYTIPVNATQRAVNPANEEAVFGFGNLNYFDLRPGGYFQRGQNVGGQIYAAPMPPLQALASFVQQQRGREAGFSFVGSKELPDLPAALKIPAAPGLSGVGIKVSYTLNGKPVEEEFYGVGYQVQVPYDGPQGRTYQTNWGLQSVHSFRAPAGTLDQRRPVFAAIVKSFRVNPAWEARLAGITQYLAAEFNRQLQAGYDQIAAAVALSKQISANNDAMIASIESQRMASRTSGGSGSGDSGAAKFDDYIRGVTTVDDPYYGTSQQSNNASFHWTDGYGNYRNSNDATYDPNRTEVGNWTPMRAVR
ncbi:MAG TPA: hypothetical protein VFV78_07645 [Vicinamibacterales bacterium]|nr:hypothetical protein [Vicinamibacterales bacterium]